MLRLLLLLALALPLAACGDVGDAPEATTTAVDAQTSTPVAFTGTALPIAADDSTVTWIGAKLTGNHIGGFQTVTGDVYVDGGQVTGADVLIDATTIYSDNERLTGHLMTGDFFEVERFPEARFQTTSLRPATAADSLEWAEATHLVTGRLTMRDQTNEVTFPAIVTYDGSTATVQSTFLINRQDWGIDYRGQADDLINDMVRISLDVTASATAGGGTPSVTADSSSATATP